MTRGKRIAQLTLAATAITIGVWFGLRATTAPPGVATSRPAVPATLATTNVVVAIRPPSSYLDVVRLTNPAVLQTELLPLPLDLRDAAHVRLDDPVYVCGRGDLWITRPDAPETSAVLAKSYDSQTHLVRERVRFAWWRDDGSGNWAAWLACDAPGGYEWVSPKSRQPMPTNLSLDWSRAILWGDDALIVPSTRGIAIVRLTPAPTVDAVDLLTPGVMADGINAPQFITDGIGVLAWIPAGADGPRGMHVARYVSGKWEKLDATVWPTGVVQLVPLVDGSVLRLTANGARVELSLAPLSAGVVDEAQVEQLVGRLSEPDPRDRLAAYKELTRFGPAAWPVLERLRDEQPPEAQLRIGQLLRDRTKPTLGGMTINDGRLRAIARDRVGGVVFYADAGVTVPAADDRTTVVNPAWVAVRPGRAPELLPTPMITDLRPDRHAIDMYGDKWLATDITNGPRQYIGRSWQRLLRDDERDFDRLIGIDTRGRWVFGHRDESQLEIRPTTSAAAPTTIASPTTRVALATARAGRVLILDPTLPDSTPKLPGWTIAEPSESGWTADNWPAVNFNGGYFRLAERGWERLDPKRPQQRLVAKLPPAPATAPAALLTAPDGTQYTDGTTTLVVESKGKPTATLPLPHDAVGSTPVHLVRTAGGHLLLMNGAGRIVRMKMVAGAPSRLTVEGVFTGKVPNGLIRRFWMDPAGRLCIAHDETGLTVFFPSGTIPPEIRTMMPAEQSDAE